LAHREVVVKNNLAHILAVSPKGKVPVLCLPDGQGHSGGRVLEQSLDILFAAQP
jgi:glutathione S-transferase